jgi:hypothetical protein
MSMQMYWKLVELCKESEFREQTIEYLAEHLGKFLRPREHVMLAFRDRSEGSISDLLEQAVVRIDAIPVIWGPDRRWNTLLRQTFESHAIAVIAEPLILLGLMKLKKQYHTPLPIRRVVSVGYPCLDWVIEGIVKGLDCELGGCFSLNESGVVAGFACGHSWGVHLRSDYFDAEIVDTQGNPLPNGELGEVVLIPKWQPDVHVHLGDWGRVLDEKCLCGSTTKRLLDLQLGQNVDPDLYQLSQELLNWTSILDCRLAKTEFGLEIEVVCFPGEKLPKMPSAAKLVVRNYNPKVDEPMWFVPKHSTKIEI